MDKAFKIAPNLAGKAPLAYAAMNSDDAKDYELVKETAVLQRYNINTEMYRQRSRTTKKQEH